MFKKYLNLDARKLDATVYDVLTPFHALARLYEQLKETLNPLKPFSHPSR